MLTSVQLVCVDGTQVIFPVEEKLKVYSDQRQILIEESILAGNYQKIGFLFSEAALLASGSTLPIRVPEKYTYLEHPFLVTAGDTNIYLELDVGYKKRGDLETDLLFWSRLSRGKRSSGLKSLMLYVTNTGDNTVTVIDRLTNSIISVIQVGIEPKGIIVDPDGQYVYIANYGSNSVSMIDTMTNEPEDSIALPLGFGPTALAIDPEGRYLYTANTDSDTVSVIDTDLKRSINTFRVGHKPIDLKVSPMGKFLYVANKGSNNLYIFKVKESKVDREVSIPVRSQPWGIAVISNNWQQDQLLVANFGSSTLSSFTIDSANLNPDTIQKTLSIIQSEYGPTQIVSDKSGRRIYVTNQKDNSASSFINTFPQKGAKAFISAQEKLYRVGSKPIGIAHDEERNYLYIVNSGDESLSVIDLRQEIVIDTIKVGKQPYGVALIKK